MNPPLFFDPRDYGAAADGRTKDTAAVQAAPLEPLEQL